MHTLKTGLNTLTDTEVLNGFSKMVREERESIANLILHLAQIHQRRLYAQSGHPSLFSFLQKEYHYSGSAAFRRIQAAKLSLYFPEIIDLFKSEKLNLVAICLIYPHVTPKNGKMLIQAAIGKTKQEIEYFLDTQFSRIEKTQDKIRRLPVIQKKITVPMPSKETCPPQSLSFKEAPSNLPKKVTATVAVKASDRVESHTQVIEIRRVKLECVVDEAVAKKIERAKQILRHKYPKGKLEDILNEALDLLLEKKDPQRKFQRMAQKAEAKTKGETIENKGAAYRSNLPKPKPFKTNPRYLSTALKKEVWLRDQGMCTYVGKNGKACTEQAGLHYDHIHPFALGGQTTPENIRLLCQSHNLYRAQQTFQKMQL
ncbi:MAG: hypothetical protein A3B70_02115 [Deltaproteobacteria bacterium RIFCSPHIGHO2_02_FULL_40_11]|nr:MAG: hypothetical protein A3B70_02115 [Deltaproteobacteria bacterium RIFCSPHIGHO2_02_FULL_40_11]